MRSELCMKARAQQGARNAGSLNVTRKPRVRNKQMSALAYSLTVTPEITRHSPPPPPPPPPPLHGVTAYFALSPVDQSLFDTVASPKIHPSRLDAIIGAPRTTRLAVRSSIIVRLGIRSLTLPASPHPAPRRDDARFAPWWDGRPGVLALICPTQKRRIFFPQGLEQTFG